jgi:hypothetical protein
MSSARRLTQPSLVIPLKMQLRRPNLPILDWAAEIHWRSRHSKKAKSSWISVPALASIVFLLRVLWEKPEE